MAIPCSRAPALTRGGRQVRWVGRGGEVRDGADVARQGQRKAADARRRTVPSAMVTWRWTGVSHRAECQPSRRAALSKIGGQPQPGALRAPLKT